MTPWTAASLIFRLERGPGIALQAMQEGLTQVRLERGAAHTWLNELMPERDREHTDIPVAPGEEHYVLDPSLDEDSLP